MLVCDLCREAHPLWGDAWRCPCGGPLTWIPSPSAPPADPPAAHGIWRHAAGLPPVAAGNRVTLGEADRTPVVDGLRLEYLSPTGSFKDRGAAVVASCLREMGVAHAVFDSSGNAGSALSAYLAAAGIRATVFAPAHASPAKLRQARVYGADVRLVEGDRAAVTAAAQAFAETSGARYASHLWSPFFVAGQRTFAYELAGEAPEAIVFPVGSGSLLLGAAQGFSALRDAGAIARVPRLFGAQVRACSPLAEAFAAGADDVAPDVVAGRSAAEGILIVRPPRARAILAAVRASGGAFVTVGDDELARAHSALARRGVFAEPTSAVAEAGRRILAAEGHVPDGPGTLVALTGSGLKSA